MSNTYLLTWNPGKWDFEGGYNTFFQREINGENPVREWRAANSSIKRGDTLFLMRLGKEPRGIILKGIAMGSGHPSKHYEVERAKAGEIINRVDVQFVSAGDYSKGEYIDWRVLQSRFPKQNWTPQASGIAIRDEYCVELNELWDRTIKNINVPIYPKDIIKLADGSIRYICGRCEFAFIKNARCPECGQAVKE